MKKISRADAVIKITDEIVDAIKCNCGCGRDILNVFLALTIADIMSEFGATSMYVTSWNRCPAHNFNEGGAEDSLHLVGRAADFVLVEYDKTLTNIKREVLVNQDAVREYLIKKYPLNLQIGLYNRGRFHLGIADTDRDSVCWDNRTKVVRS
jgi:hypothetical protein